MLTVNSLLKAIHITISFVSSVICVSNMRPKFQHEESCPHGLPGYNIHYLLNLTGPSPCWGTAPSFARKLILKITVLQFYKSLRSVT